MIQELWLRVDEEVRRVRPYLWVAAVLAALIFAAGALLVSSLPSIYDAWGQIYVAKQTPVSVAAGGLSATGEGYGGAYVVQRTLLNDQNLARVLDAVDPEFRELGSVAAAADIAALRRKIKVTGDANDGFVEFHFADPNPIRARTTVQAVLDLFISSSISRSHRELSRAETFLDDQLTASQAPLARSRARLAALRGRHAGLAGAAPTAPEEPDVAPAPAEPVAIARPSEAAERLSALRARLATLRESYTDAYPDVVAVRRQIVEATAAAAQEAREAPPAAGASGRGVRLSARRRARAAPATDSPALAAEYAEALRDEEALRDRYQDLTTRREAARMSQAVYGADVSEKFEVTREPTTPIAPVGPPRGLYLAMAAALAIAGGLGAAYLLAALRGVVVSPREVARTFELPVVATVSRTAAWAKARRTRPRAPLEQGPRGLIAAGGHRLTGDGREGAA